MTAAGAVGQSRGRYRVVYALLVIAVLAAPLIVPLIHLTALQVDFSRYVPALEVSLSDGFYYWRQAYTFAHAGMNGGYYTYLEYEAPAPFSHFYFYGPVIAIFYGTLGRLFGWGLGSAPLIHILLVTGALGLLVACARPSRRQLVMLFLLVATFSPLLLYLPITMQESIHQALALVYAAGFYAALTRRDALPTWGKVGLWLAIAFGSSLRISWVLLFIPFFLLIWTPGRRRAALAVGMLCIVGFVGLVFYLSAPFQGGFFAAFFQTLAVNPVYALNSLRIHIDENLRFFAAGNDLEMALRLVLLALILTAALGLFQRRGQRWARLHRLWPAGSRTENGLHLYALGTLLVVQVLIYDIGAFRDYRIFAPPVLFSLVLMILFGRYRFAALQASLHVVTVTTFLVFATSIWQPLFGADLDRLARFEQDLARVLPYDPDTQNAWCNTLYIQYPELMNYDLLKAPPGIGISFFMNFAATKTQVRSRYVYMTDALYDTLDDTVNFSPLLVTDQGTIYRNLRVDC